MRTVRIAGIMMVLSVSVVNVQAAMVFRAMEVNGDVVITSDPGGSMNVGGLVSGPEIAANEHINPSEGNMFIGCGNPNASGYCRVDSYKTPLTTSFGAGTGTTTGTPGNVYHGPNGTGPVAGVFTQIDLLLVPKGYVSGSILDVGQSTFPNATFESLGMDAGIFTWSWANDSITLIVESADMDGDGISDDSDNCPAAPNPLQENNDGDMLGDVCDPDDDNDGTNDVTDNCPIDGNPDQADFDHDGLGDVCDATLDAGSIAQHIENEVAGIVQILSALNVPGGNGMIKKLTGGGGVVKKMSSAVTAFEGGYIDFATYLAELDGALSMLDAFDNQIAAKIAKNKIVDPDAAAIVAASTEIRAMMDNLRVAAGG